MKKIGKDLWKRSEDGDNREQRSFFRYAIVATAFFVLFIFVKKDNVITWIQSGITLRQQEHRLEQFEQSNSKLDSTIEMLESNRDSLERFAREKYYFAEPGDDIYIIGE